MQLIPAIDLRDGEVVRLRQGDFTNVTHYAYEPVALACQLATAGARQLHIVDLDGARNGCLQQGEVIRRMIEAAGIPIQIGGGIRDAKTLEQAYATGANRIVIGSRAVDEPAIFVEWLNEFGPEKLVLAVDVRLDPGQPPEVRTHGWTRTATHSLWKVIDGFLVAGLRHVLCTDVARDGVMSGPSVELYGKCVSRYPGLALQASGGIRDAADLETLRETGVSGAICGKAILDGRIRLEEVVRFLPGA